MGGTFSIAPTTYTVQPIVNIDTGARHRDSILAVSLKNICIMLD